MSAPTPRSAGERLAQLEEMVQTLSETVTLLEEYIRAMHQTQIGVWNILHILPDILNQSMPAVRAAEVRKFRNHLDVAELEAVKRLDKLEPEEN